MNKPMKTLYAILAAAGIVISLAAFGLMWTCIGLAGIGLWELGLYTIRRLRTAAAQADQILAEELGPEQDDNTGETR